jgi:hypothetical protein
MNRAVTILVSSVVIGAISGVTLLADVKTKERTTVRVEGLLGSFINRAAGGNDGITSTVALKGSRMVRTQTNSGQVVDLSEEKVYNLDVRRKEYTVRTFAELRQELLEQKKKLEDQARSMPQADKEQVDAAARQLEYDVTVNETGQRKSVAGHDARQVIVAVTMREAGKKLEESGGFVMTMDQWLGDVPALVELRDFQMKYFKAVFDGVFSGSDLQTSNMLAAMIPGFQQASQRLAAEAQKLTGTALSSTTTFESVKSDEQMKAAQQPQSGGRGLGGMIAGRLMNRGPVEQRARMMTMTHEFLAIEASASDADVALPAGLRERR